MKTWLFLLTVLLVGCNAKTAYNPNYHILLEQDDPSTILQSEEDEDVRLD